MDTCQQLSVGPRMRPETWRAGMPLLVLGCALVILTRGLVTPGSPRFSESDFQRSFAQSTLYFEPSGSAPGAYVARAGGGSLRLTSGELAFSLGGGETPGRGPGSERPPAGAVPERAAPVRMVLVGRNPDAQLSGEQRLEGVVHYYLGGGRPRTGVPTYRRLVSRSVYPAIDAVYYGKQSTLEYDFVVHPGGNPRDIRLRFLGAESVQVDAGGDLVVETPGGELRHRRPEVYQQSGSRREPVPSRYLLLPGGEVGFDIGAYDRRRTLVIDPVIYLGGSRADLAYAVASRQVGVEVPRVGDEPPDLRWTYDVFVTGSTTSDDLNLAASDPAPAVRRQYPTKATGETVAFVSRMRVEFSARYSILGTRHLYTTLLGGGQASKITVGTGVAVIPGSNEETASVVGYTDSPNLPAAYGRFQPLNRGLNTTAKDAFVGTLAGDGRLLSLSYLGGSGNDEARGVANGPDGALYVVGYTASPDFRIVRGFQAKYGGGAADVFAARVIPWGPTASRLNYSTFVGGKAKDEAFAVTADPGAGGSTFYLTGLTNSEDFPPGGFKPPFNRGLSTTFSDAFVVGFKHASSGPASLESAMLLGGSRADIGYGIALDPEDRQLWVVGATSSLDFPLAAASPSLPPVQGVYGGGDFDAFISRVPLGGTAPSYSTYCGGTLRDQATAVAYSHRISPNQEEVRTIGIGGFTASLNFPADDEYGNTSTGKNDAFLLQFAPEGGLHRAVQFGGPEVDTIVGVSGDLVAAGRTFGIGNAPVFPVGSQPSGEQDSFIKVQPAEAYDILDGTGSGDDKCDLVWLKGPADLKATLRDSSSILLTWRPRSTEHSSIIIYRAIGAGSPFTLYQTLPGGARSFVDRGNNGEGLALETLYRYRVRAYKAAKGDCKVYWEYSNGTKARTLGPPAAFSVKRVPGRFSLSWKSGSNFQSGFYLRRTQRTPGTAIWSAPKQRWLPNTSGKNAPAITFVDPPASEGPLSTALEYRYQLMAYDPRGYSTEVVLVVGKPLPPQRVQDVEAAAPLSPSVEAATTAPGSSGDEGR